MNVPVIDPTGAIHDAGIPQLRSALDPSIAEQALRQTLPEPFTSEPCRLLSIQVLRHKPGRRCLIAYNLKATDRRGEQAAHAVLGKIRAKGLDRRSFELLNALRRNGWDDDSPDGVSVPRPLALVPELDMWLQVQVPGQLAATLLLSPGGPVWAARLAEALVKLHRTRNYAKRRHTLADELAILDDRLSRVAMDQPSWAPRLVRIYEGCRELAASLPLDEPTGIHRDFYPDQAIVSGERVYLLDWDLYCLGDAALDAGNFLAHLVELAFRRHDSADALADRERAFLRRYLQLAGLQQRRAVQIYRLLSLVRHIYISTMFAERRRHTLAWIALCEQELSRCQRSCATALAEVDDGQPV